MISILQPQSLNEIGWRDNNEDSIYPIQDKATLNNKLFIVCDGVGGSDYGEVASQLACESLADYFTFEEDFDPEKALNFIKLRFNDFIDLNPDHREMATTMVFLLLQDDHVIIGWIGDSRVYHIRESEILFQTEDHSLVMEMVKSGEITPKQAENDYRKNIITRTVNGMDIAVKMDYIKINDIHSNDYFLLCSDGLLENVNEKLIGKLFNGGNSPGIIKNKIESLCRDNTNDNYSMYVIQVE